jgi:hypothetical protein
MSYIRPIGLDRRHPPERRRTSMAYILLIIQKPPSSSESAGGLRMSNLPCLRQAGVSKFSFSIYKRKNLCYRDTISRGFDKTSTSSPTDTRWQRLILLQSSSVVNQRQMRRPFLDFRFCKFAGTGSVHASLRDPCKKRLEHLVRLLRYLLP